MNFTHNISISFFPKHFFYLDVKASVHLTSTETRSGYDNAKSLSWVWLIRIEPFFLLKIREVENVQSEFKIDEFANYTEKKHFASKYTPRYQDKSDRSCGPWLITHVRVTLLPIFTYKSLCPKIIALASVECFTGGREGKKKM